MDKREDNDHKKHLKSYNKCHSTDVATPYPPHDLITIQFRCCNRGPKWLKMVDQKGRTILFNAVMI